jgi:hypothetical protein
MNETKQQLRYDEEMNQCYLETLYYRNGIQILSSEPISSEEAALWKAQNQF